MPKKNKTPRVKLIVNPGAGNAADAAEQLRLVTDYLEKHGLKVDAALARSKEKATRLARRAVKAGDRLVAAMGGDGTVEAVMRGLLGSQARLGIIPTGVENNLARSLGIPTDLGEACALMASDQTLNLDLGQITVGKDRQYLFFERAILGLLETALPLSQKAWSGKDNGVQIAAPTLIRQEVCPKVSLRLDQDKKIEVETRLVIVSIAPVLGKSFPAAPAAALPEGVLDITVYPGFGKAELLRYYAAVLDGTYAEDGKIQHYQARKVKVKTSPQLQVLADGVVLGKGPVVIQMRKAVLRIIAARHSPVPNPTLETLVPEPLVIVPGKNHRQPSVMIPG